jgi:DNA-binding helix-hairpin-helix protein with protein kinase domain
MNERFFDGRGKALELGAELGRGGEAIVYSLVNNPSLAFKRYHQEVPLEKLERMIANAPLDPSQQDGHVSIAWPIAIVKDQQGKAQGFLMPRTARRAIPLHQLYNPKIRRQRASGISWRYLLRIARNLATVVAALHDKGYVIGDLNESNVLVTDRALVTLVDCDSVQVKAGHKVFRCTVGKAEYTAPEVQGKSFHKLIRQQQHDLFALSVLIFLLLMEGVHPFSGVSSAEGDPPLIMENIRHGRSPFLGSPVLAPALTAPPFDLLPKGLQKDLKRGLRQPAWRGRPGARHLQTALEALEASLQTCPLNPNHVFGRHLKGCPWCERLAKLGLEAFPGIGSSLVNPQATSVTLPKPFRGTFWRFLKSHPLTILISLLSAGLVSFGLTKLTSELAVAWRYGLPIGFFILLGLAISSWFMQKSKQSSQFFNRLQLGERLLQAALGAAALASSLGVLSDLIFGHGSIVKGDYLLVPPLWLLSFLLLWRLLKKPHMA